MQKEKQDEISLAPVEHLSSPGRGHRGQGGGAVGVPGVQR